MSPASLATKPTNSKEQILLLVNRIKQKDELAKEEFVALLTPLLRKITFKLAISPYELQSSIDWVLTKIINNIDHLDSQKNILGYVVNSVRNYCIDEYRKLCVRTRKEGHYKQLNANKVTTLEHTVDFLIDDVCRDDQEKVILRKIVFDKQSLLDVAKEIDVPVKKIKNLLERVKSDLL